MNNRMNSKPSKTRLILIIALILTILVSLVVQRYFSYRNSFYYVHPLPEYETTGSIIKGMLFMDEGFDFERMKNPKPGEWLYSYPEMGQSFEDYKKINPVRKTENRSKIVIQPLGKFTEEEMKVLEKSVEFIGIYYDSPVELKEPITNLDKKFSRERNDGGVRWTQFKTKYLINDILMPNIPDDAICYFGVTMNDLYPDDNWNYCFGEAMLKERVGVYSLFRNFPGHFGGEKTKDYEQVVLRRSCKVMAHEIGHIFSMWHCVYFQCLMCGSNNLKEMDTHPIHLCPICLKKMEWNLGFDMKERYRQLHGFYKKNGLEDEAEWTGKRMGK